MRTLVTGRARSANGRFRGGALRKARIAVTPGQGAWGEAESTGKARYTTRTRPTEGATRVKSGHIRAPEARPLVLVSRSESDSEASKNAPAGNPSRPLRVCSARHPRVAVA
jgi:hypothetical protein